MKRDYQKWFSKSLNRNMELLIFGHSGAAVLFFPTRTARFFDYENWGMIDSIQDRIDAGELQIFCVDSIDQESFYAQQVAPAQRIERHLQYEAYILKEVMPLLVKDDKNRETIVAGCSMGAFHALNLAFKHPGLFAKVIAMSGRYDLTQRLGNFQDLFNGYTNETIYYNSPTQYMENLSDPAILAEIRKLAITIVIGERDAFLENNKQMDSILWRKNIEHQFYIWQGEAHKPKYWKQMLRLYF